MFSSGQSYGRTEIKSNATPAFSHTEIEVNPTNIFEYEAEEAHILAMAFAQTYSLVKGLKKFGSVGEEAVYAEIERLHNRGCFKPIHIESYGSESRRQLMESIMFLTEKRDGTIKARNVTNGRKQQTWMSKEEAASPTITAVIDAKENRDACVVDLPHAFVQTPNEKANKEHPPDVMKVRGRLVDMLLEIDPQMYAAPYIKKENGVAVLYMEILRALYGMIKRPLLFYRKLRRDLESIDFKTNPYDICVANKQVNGNQLTVAFHVDDLKVSHVDPKVVDKFLEWIKKLYEDPTLKKNVPSRGKIHNYLVMTLDYSIPGKIKY
jgi:hypothetical protein